MQTSAGFEAPSSRGQAVTDYVIGLGANLGARAATLRAALALLEADPELRLGAVSSLYESAAIGPTQPPYLNAAVRVETALAAEALLDRLHAIEAQLGRVRGERWGPRTLDLDLLWSSRPVATRRLRIPHRELERRWFALSPLIEVLPELAPIYGPVLQELDATPAEPLPLRRRARVEALGGGDEALRASAAEPLEAAAELLSALGERLSGAAPVATRVTRTLELRGPAPLQAAVQAVIDAAAAGFGVAQVTMWDMAGEHVRLSMVGGPTAVVRARAEAAEARPEAHGHVATLVIRRKISDS
jgi:2-amino-4-hydroxy-6-hydroxymethyldihydropteridine diphosphokinase